MARIVRNNGFIVKEMDLINHLINRGVDRAIAERIAAKSPTWVGNPLTGDQFTAAINRMNRADEIATMQAERQKVRFF